MALDIALPGQSERETEKVRKRGRERERGREKEMYNMDALFLFLTGMMGGCLGTFKFFS
jgi:hypothetical protein